MIGVGKGGIFRSSPGGKRVNTALVDARESVGRYRKTIGRRIAVDKKPISLRDRRTRTINDYGYGVVEGREHIILPYV